MTQGTWNARRFELSLFSSWEFKPFQDGVQSQFTLNLLFPSYRILLWIRFFFGMSCWWRVWRLDDFPSPKGRKVSGYVESLAKSLGKSRALPSKMLPIDLYLASCRSQWNQWFPGSQKKWDAPACRWRVLTAFAGCWDGVVMGHPSWKTAWNGSV